MEKKYKILQIGPEDWRDTLALPKPHQTALQAGDGPFRPTGLFSRPLDLRL